MWVVTGEKQGTRFKRILTQRDNLCPKEIRASSVIKYIPLPRAEQMPGRKTNPSCSPCVTEHTSCERWPLYRNKAKEPLPQPQSPSTDCLPLTSQLSFYKEFCWEDVSVSSPHSLFLAPPHRFSTCPLNCRGWGVGGCLINTQQDHSLNHFCLSSWPILLLFLGSVTLLLGFLSLWVLEML